MKLISEFWRKCLTVPVVAGGIVTTLVSKGVRLALFGIAVIAFSAVSQFLLRLLFGIAGIGSNNGDYPIAISVVLTLLFASALHRVFIEDLANYRPTRGKGKGR